MVHANDGFFQRLAPCYRRWLHLLSSRTILFDWSWPG